MLTVLYVGIYRIALELSRKAEEKHKKTASIVAQRAMSQMDSAAGGGLLRHFAVGHYSRGRCSGGPAESRAAAALRPRRHAAHPSVWEAEHSEGRRRPHVELLAGAGPLHTGGPDHFERLAIAEDADRPIGVPEIRSTAAAHSARGAECGAASSAGSQELNSYSSDERVAKD